MALHVRRASKQRGDWSRGPISALSLPDRVLYTLPREAGATRDSRE
jgi:hypothetical protein